MLFIEDLYYILFLFCGFDRMLDQLSVMNYDRKWLIKLKLY